jgi:hypothetical protein
MIACSAGHVGVRNLLVAERDGVALRLVGGVHVLVSGIARAAGLMRA